MAKAPLKGKPQLIDIDPTLLSDAEKAALRERALERVAKERKEHAMDAFLEQEIAQARKAHLPAQEIKYISLDMAGHADRIMIDGVVYFHGQTYEVPKCLYDVLAEVVARGWEHEDEIGGANRNSYRKPRSTALRPGMVGMSATQILGSR